MMEEANTSHNRIQSMTTKAHNVLDKLEATENFLNTHQSSYSFGEVAKPRHDTDSSVSEARRDTETFAVAFRPMLSVAKNGKQHVASWQSNQVYEADIGPTHQRTNPCLLLASL